MIDQRPDNEDGKKGDGIVGAHRRDGIDRKGRCALIYAR